MLHAIVGDERTGAFIGGAEVGILGLDARGITDSLGTLTIVAIPSGTRVVYARRLGYAPVLAAVTLAERDTLEVTLLTHRVAQELPEVSITDSSPWSLREFEARRRRHIGGFFVTDSVLRTVPGGNLAEVALARIPGIRGVHGLAHSVYVFSTRGSNSILGGPCQVAVYLDGLKVTDGDAGIVPLDLLGGVEYYPPGFAPVQYRQSGSLHSPGHTDGGDASCGVLLLWSRP